MKAREVGVDDEPPQLRRERRMPSLEGGSAMVDLVQYSSIDREGDWPGRIENLDANDVVLETRVGFNMMKFNALVCARHYLVLTLSLPWPRHHLDPAKFRPPSTIL
jgi:hypothetical protein